MKQKSTSFHHKPKAVDKGNKSDNWRQVFTDIGQSLGFSGESKSKQTSSTKIPPVQKEKRAKEIEAPKQLQVEKLVQRDIDEAELSQVPEEQKQESDVKKSLL